MDIYFKKEITYSLEGRTYHFDIGETLFSTFDIDHGTDILLRSIAPETIPNSILDLGCGYGPIGITLAGKYPNAKIEMLDRDLLAVRYANNNCAQNGVNNAQAYGSVGMETVKDKKFDLIVSNIPAKIGDEAISQEFILEPCQHLNQAGELWIVVVNALNRLIPKVCSRNNLPFNEIRNRNGHTVYRIKKG